MADSTVHALTENTDPLDDDEMYLVDDPAGTPANARLKIRRVRWSGLAVPYFTKSTIHISHPCAGITSAAAVTANRLYVHPCIVPYRRAFTAIACHGSTATGNVRMGIYNSIFSTANGFAVGTLVAECASTAVVANDVTTAAITATLDEGLYFLAAVFDNTPTMRPFATGSGPILGIDFGTVAPNGSPAGFYSAHTYGALPNLTGVAQTNTNPVAVGIR